jgi:hypothetical protein
VTGAGGAARTDGFPAPRLDTTLAGQWQKHRTLALALRILQLRQEQPMIVYTHRTIEAVTA